MARAIRRYTCELTKDIVQKHVDDMTAGDREGHEFVISVTRDGAPVSGMTSCIGYVMRADGTTVPCRGTVSDNEAHVILQAAAYGVVGRTHIIIRAEQGSERLTILTGNYNVNPGETDSYVDPEHIVPSMEELLAKIGEMEAATKDANNAVAELERKVAAGDFNGPQGAPGPMGAVVGSVTASVDSMGDVVLAWS